MQAHGTVLVVIGLIGTFVILALGTWRAGPRADVAAEPPASTIAATVTPMPTLTPTATPEPVPTETPVPPPTETPEPTATPLPQPNRFSCSAIRGTSYLSSAERTWFLNNC